MLHLFLKRVEDPEETCGLCWRRRWAWTWSVLPSHSRPCGLYASASGSSTCLLVQWNKPRPVEREWRQRWIKGWRMTLREEVIIVKKIKWCWWWWGWWWWCWWWSGWWTIKSICLTLQHPVAASQSHLPPASAPEREVPIKIQET